MPALQARHAPHTRTLSPLPPEDVIDSLLAWHADGLKTALVTLVGIDGATPRPLGAQMAVAQDGRYAGYLSGGCFEPAVAKDAQFAISEQKNRIERYGKGSRYLDLRLPCDSGLDIYFDQNLDEALLAEAGCLRCGRQPFAIVTDLASGESRVESSDALHPIKQTQRTGDIFRRIYQPQLRILLAGGGPGLAAIAKLMAVTGFEVTVLTPEVGIRTELAAAGLETSLLTSASQADLSFADPWTAVVVAFHEHEWEAPLIARLLEAPCFYTGVMGSRRAHEKRLAQLKQMGCGETDLRRLRSPIGLIDGAKCQISLAAGVLAEVVQHAKTAGLLP